MNRGGQIAMQVERAPINTRIGYASVARTRGAAVTGEMKYYDCSANRTIPVLGTSWVAANRMDPEYVQNNVLDPLTLFVPTLGTNVFNRIGKSVKVLRIKIKGTVRMNTSAAQTLADTAMIVRVLLVQDNQTNSAAVNPGLVLADGDIAGILTVLTFQNFNNFGRFKVLKDKHFAMGDNNMAGSAPNIVVAGAARNFKFNVNFPVPEEVRFNQNNAGLIGDVIDKSWHLIAGCSTGDVTMALSYNCRFCFKE